MGAKNSGHGVGVHLILIADDSVLLGLRENTGFGDGYWSTPGGGLERGEAAKQAVIREAREEIGISLAPEDLALTHVCHHFDPDGNARIGLYFTTRRWTGEPINAEPDKCTKLAWHPLDALPDNTVGYARHAITAAAGGVLYSEHDWPDAS